MIYMLTKIAADPANRVAKCKSARPLAVVEAEAKKADPPRGFAKALKATIAQTIVQDFAITPHEVVIVPQGTLPRTSSGKPQRRKTRELYLNGTLVRARTVQAEGGNTEDAGASA